jgi:hypothetical protein
MVAAEAWNLFEVQHYLRLLHRLNDARAADAALTTMQ